MRTWTFSINALPEYRYGVVTVIEQPWWLALIDWLSDWLCLVEDGLSYVPFPNWFPRKRDDGDDGLYTLREWYGDLGSVFHVRIHDPIWLWCWQHPKRKEYDLHVGYDKVKELFYETDREFFDEHEALG